MTTDQRLDRIERILTLFFNAGRREQKRVREVDEKITILINAQIKNDDRFQELRDETNRKWQETDRRFQETTRQLQETGRQMRETDGCATQIENGVKRFVSFIRSANYFLKRTSELTDSPKLRTAQIEIKRAH